MVRFYKLVSFSPTYQGIIFFNPFFFLLVDSFPLLAAEFVAELSAEAAFPDASADGAVPPVGVVPSAAGGVSSLGAAFVAGAAVPVVSVVEGAVVSLAAGVSTVSAA